MTDDATRTLRAGRQALVGSLGILATLLLKAAQGSSFDAGGKPTDVAAGDVNGDRRLDLVIASSGSDAITVLLGDGKGGFRPAPGSPFPAGRKPHLVALADLDGDGRLDCAATEHDGNEVRVLLGKGDGSFRLASTPRFVALARTPPHNHGLSAIDVSGDGKPDLITTNHADDSVSVLLGDGRGLFTPAPGSPFSAGKGPYPHASGDMNGDGAIDLVVPDVGAGTVTVLRNDGKGRFAALPAPARVSGRPFQVALGDVDRDGKLDAVVACDEAPARLLRGDGKGGLVPGPAIDTGGQVQDVALADVDGDRKLDLVAARRGTIVVLKGDGKGGFSLARGSALAAGDGIYSVTVADLDGDGRADVAAPDMLRNRVAVLLSRP
jgi:hypothetical protein